MAAITESLDLSNPNTIALPPSRTRANPSPPSPSSSSSQLLSLPTELFDLIAAELPYPDALALKHSSQALYPLVDTSVPLKVAWLDSRHVRGLAVPRRNCVLRTDAAFCAGGDGEVRRIMEERRWHRECNADGQSGCEVLVGRHCHWASGRQRRLQGGRRMILVMMAWGWDERMAGVILGAVLAVVIQLVLWFCIYGNWPRRI